MAEMKMRYRERQNPNSAGFFAAITTSDTVNYVHPEDANATLVARGIYVGTGGNIVAINIAGSAVTFSNVPAGTTLAIDHIRVNQTNTTASNLVRLD